MSNEDEEYLNYKKDIAFVKEKYRNCSSCIFFTLCFTIFA